MSKDIGRVHLQPHVYGATIGLPNRDRIAGHYRTVARDWPYLQRSEAEQHHGGHGREEGHQDHPHRLRLC